MFGPVVFSLTLALCKLGLAQETGYFLNPPNGGKELFFVDNNLYSIGDSLSVQWVTDQSYYSIWLWQQSLTVRSATPGQAIYTKIIGGPELGGFNWTVTRQSFDLAQSNVFFLSLGPTGEIMYNTTTCHYFNLTQSVQSESTTSAVPSATSTLSTIASPTTPSNSAITIPSSSHSDNQNGDEKAKNVGIGVGVGLGVPLFAVCLFLAVKRIRKSRNTGQPNVQPLPPGIAGYGDFDKGGLMSPREMSGDHFKYIQDTRENNSPSVVELPVDSSAPNQRSA